MSRALSIRQGKARRILRVSVPTVLAVSIAQAFRQRRIPQPIVRWEPNEPRGLLPNEAALCNAWLQRQLDDVRRVLPQG
jgi:hypothetical protein